VTRNHFCGIIACVVLASGSAIALIDLINKKPPTEYIPFVEGTWTCDNTVKHTTETGEAFSRFSPSVGPVVEVPMLSGEVKVDGKSLSGDLGDKMISGIFTNPSTLTINITPKDGDSKIENIICWQGGIEKRPR
jgi:hypothetical protein